MADREVDDALARSFLTDLRAELAGRSRAEGERAYYPAGTAVYAFGSVRQRVAAHLLDLASDEQRPGGRLVAQVSQQDLADSPAARPACARHTAWMPLSRRSYDMGAASTPYSRHSQQ